jgi:signal transduction histidine kinase
MVNDVLSLTEELRRVEVFADLPDDQLAWLAEHAEVASFAAGEVTIAEGAPADSLVILFEGEVQARREKGPADGRVIIIRAGEVTGMLPFSRMTHYNITGRAVTPVRMARIHTSLFPEMLDRIPVLEARLVGLLTDRVREATRVEQQREKLISLGKLSAGLAHELNNPAAAASRSAGELRRRLVTLRELTVDLAECEHAGELIHLAAELREKAAARSGDQELDPLASSEREDALTEWLEGHGVERAWVIAGTFAGAGLTVADLDALGSLIDNAGEASSEALSCLLSWVEEGLAIDALASEVESAVRRISELVGAVKSYSHMDSGQAKGPTDLHRDLDSTLTMLTHKVRAKNVQVTRDYAAGLPEIQAFAGELNQVWTNLLDNAFDAVAPGGTVEISTRRENGFVRIDVRDDGPGIPEDVLDSIWDPFFTTKPMGQGTGLGLDIARRIVERRHGGEMSVESAPGDTRFTVRLPV